MRTILIDDERLARKELKSLLTSFNDIEIIGEAANADEGKTIIESEKPDLIFLDIQMPGKTGFEMLQGLSHLPKVIFVTAYDEYALRAFEVNALDYLLKPIDEERLEEAIKKLNAAPAEEVGSTISTEEPEGKLNLNDQIFLKDGDKCWFVRMSDVRLFESEGNYVRVFFENYKPLILKSLNNLEKRLDEKEFFRINRKFIVNLKEIDHIEPWFNGGLQIRLKDGTSLEVSRRQSSKFKELLSL
jgi:two-component system LytT family response regulator